MAGKFRNSNTALLSIWHPSHAGISCSPLGTLWTHHCDLASGRDLCPLLHALNHRTWDHASARGGMVRIFSPCIRRVGWILGGLHRLDRATCSDRPNLVVAFADSSTELQPSLHGYVKRVSVASEIVLTMLNWLGLRGPRLYPISCIKDRA